jgi:hypothetical protein
LVAGLSNLNGGADGTLQDLGNSIFELTVPIDISLSTTVSGQDVTLHITGSLQASATVNLVTPITGLGLSGASVKEFRPAGTLVGAFSSTEASGGHTFTYSLVDGPGSADNAAFTISGDQLLTADAFDYGARNSYSVRVRTTDETGQTFEQAFTISVLDDKQLLRVGQTLTVTGTAGNDAFSFAAGAVWDSMTLNGVRLAVDSAAVSRVVFQGGLGVNSAALTGGPGPNTLSLTRTGGALSGPGYAVGLVGVQFVTATGGPGDRVFLYGSPWADAFVGTAASATLAGPGFRDQVNGFSAVTATGAGGGDRAYLVGSPGDDTFVGRPGSASLSGPGFVNQANGFATVWAYAGAGGNDQAALYGTTGHDLFRGSGMVGTLQGPGYYLGTSGFEAVSIVNLTRLADHKAVGAVQYNLRTFGPWV